MKECIYQRKYGRCQIKCGYTGTIKNKEKCVLQRCKYFYPTLRYRLFGEWWKKR